MNWEENVCDGSGGVVAGRDGSMSVCELPDFWSGRVYQTQEWDKTCADLTPESGARRIPSTIRMAGASPETPPLLI